MQSGSPDGICAPCVSVCYILACIRKPSCSWVSPRGSSSLILVLGIIACCLLSLILSPTKIYVFCLLIYQSWSLCSYPSLCWMLMRNIPCSQRLHINQTTNPGWGAGQLLTTDGRRDVRWLHSVCWNKGDPQIPGQCSRTGGTDSCFWRGFFCNFSSCTTLFSVLTSNCLTFLHIAQELSVLLSTSGFISPVINNSTWKAFSESAGRRIIISGGKF